MCLKCIFSVDDLLVISLLLFFSLPISLTLFFSLYLFFALSFYSSVLVYLFFSTLSLSLFSTRTQSLKCKAFLQLDFKHESLALSL